MELNINCIAVLGAGTMGTGIALFFAANKYLIILYDPSREALSGAQDRIANNGAIAGLEYASENIRYTTFLDEAIPSADLIIETAPENIVIKRILYSQISPLLKGTAIVVSNTSTFPLSKLSENQPFSDRMIIMHFFNPAHLVPLVEIVATEKTLAGLANAVAALLYSLGKCPVVLKNDIYGFIANRLQAAVLREACSLIENDIADASQVDDAVKNGLAVRWILNGPFEIADFGGLDIWNIVLNNLLPLLDSATEAPKIIQEKVNRNELGLKTGKGFFNYDKKGMADAMLKRNRNLARVWAFLKGISR